ncbi:uncharacterized protein LOC124144456 isoform X2 [Haliotis rufescens]|nr:uncharacterized protein LOC124144456 isoform X2 [Haliotis rufescens]
MPSKRGRGHGQSRQDSLGGEQAPSTPLNTPHAGCGGQNSSHLDLLDSGSPESIEVDVPVHSRDNSAETNGPSKEGGRNVSCRGEKMGVTSLKTSLQCVVCADNASGQYFGATVCLPCKSFYIRCTKEGEPVFSSKCHGSCDVTKQARIRCQSCRYQKCLKAGMTRREKPERIEPEEGQYLCLVCGDLANGIHFGVYTCEGCKKFFRRGLVENRTYQCKGDNTCVINPRSRNTCRACRYRKCLSVGMSRDAIKMGRPKKKDLDCCRVEGTSTPSSYPTMIDETEEILVLHSNESDSSNDIEMLEIKARPNPPPSAVPLDYSLPTTEDSVVDKPMTSSKPTSTGISGTNVLRTPWSKYALQQMITSLPRDRLSLKSLSSLYIPPSTSSTVTSASEYKTYEDEEKRLDNDDVYGRPFTTEQEDAQEDYILEEASVLPVESECTCPDSPSTDSTSYEAPVTDPSALYSMSSDEIDSMLKLLEDFERPASPSHSCRRKSSSSMEDTGGKRRKPDLGHSEEGYSGNFTSTICERFLKTTSNPPSSWQQGKQYHSTSNQRIYELNVESNNGSMTSAMKSSVGLEIKKYGQSLPQATTGATYSAAQPPTDECSTGNAAVGTTTYASINSILRSQQHSTSTCSHSLYGQECGCGCWQKRKTRNQTTLRDSDTSNRRKVTRKGDVHSAPLPNIIKTRDVYEQGEENQSLKEISKAFEVLYDKAYDNNAPSEWPRRAKSCNMSTDSDSESDTECSCKCIQVTGLCLCQGPPGQQSGNTVSRDIFMSAIPSSLAGVWNTQVFESASPYLFMKYLKQIPDIMGPTAITDVQQKIMQNLLDSYLNYINNAEMKARDQIPSSPEISLLLGDSRQPTNISDDRLSCA